MARTAFKPAERVVVDSSAILAILFQESGWESVLEIIESAEYAGAAAPNKFASRV